MLKYQSANLFKEEIKESQCHHIIRVAFEAGVDTEFDYLVPDEIWPIEVGQRVEVPFGKKNKLQIGFCIEADISHREQRNTQSERPFRLKKIARTTQTLL